MQTRDAKGDISYYRINVSGDAKLAKTTYRAGLYDAAALDALMNQISSEDKNSVDQELERQRREAVGQLASEYYSALAMTNSPQSQLDEYARRLGQALVSPYDIAANATPQGQLRPERKFAIIFSANASIVEEAIADFVEAKETEATVTSAIAGVKRESFIEATVEKKRLDRLRSLLQSVSKDANILGPRAGGDTNYVENVRRLLNDVATMPIN